MLRFFLFLILFISIPTLGVSSDLTPQISKLEFQGVHFGDFPGVDMICIRGLCPVGEVGVGISTNSFIPTAYNQKTAITHFHGVKISTPEYSYFEDKMYMIKFSIECKSNAEEECVDAVKRGLDTEYGLKPLVSTRSDSLTSADEFVTESGSLVAIIRSKEGGRSSPTVRIVDNTLMNQLRRFYNPNYLPVEIEIQKPEQGEKALSSPSK
jgi:hypothetical protein